MRRRYALHVGESAARRKLMLRLGLLLAAAALAALVLGVGRGNAGSSASPKVTLNLMSVAQGPGLEGAWADTIAAFEKAYPNITVKRSPVAYANYRTAVKLHASASDAPDLVEGDMGPGGVMASLVPGHLLLPLDRYAAKYGWHAKFGPFISQLRLGSDGKHVGTGPIYGVPDFAELLGVFYNKAQLAKLHLKLPTTFAAFEASLAAAKQGGVTPLMIGGLDKFPWSHMYDVLADHYGNPHSLINWFRGVHGTTIINPGMMKAGEVLQQWVKNGYFEDGANGVSDADAVTRFDHGESLYKLDGPWATQQNSQALGKKLGFFLMPPLKAGAFPASTGWMGWSVGVTAKSKNPDAAAAFVNFLTTSAARAIFMKHSNPPGTPGTTYGPRVDPVVRTIGTAYNGEVRRSQLVPYMDVAYPQAAPYDMLANAQAMAAGKMSVADFLKASQKGWATYHGYGT
jgi:raffinose/stachyose/melibiose transport system substrate-binding protein